MIASILQAYSPYFLLFLTSLLGWISWSLKTKFATKLSQDEIIKRVEKLEDKITDFPTKQDIHKIAINLERMSGELNSQKSIMTRVEKTLDLQQEFLLNRSKQ